MTMLDCGNLCKYAAKRHNLSAKPVINLFTFKNTSNRPLTLSAHQLVV